MDESAAAVADPAHERAHTGSNLRSASTRAANRAAPLPGLLDPRIVRAELARLRGPGPAIALGRTRPWATRRGSASDVHRHG